MKKGKRDLILGVSFITIAIGTVFLIDYFNTQSLLKNGIRANAVITGRYFEVSSGKDTSSYSMRLQTVPDTNSNKGGLTDAISAYVKKETFYKYSEGVVVKVVYKKDDRDHAKLVEEIE
jgi:hypothetical protein